jgi:hypothetical protein
MYVIRSGVATAITRARQATTHKVPEGARLFQEEASRLSPVGPGGAGNGPSAPAEREPLHSPRLPE